LAGLRKIKAGSIGPVYEECLLKVLGIERLKS
jgi:hypothetical protein